jgi:hypothetical protein
MRLLFLGALALAFVATPTRAETYDIPLDMSGPRPAVSISINGEPAELWTFDTGAGGTIMNIDRARALNLPEEQPVQIGSPAGGTPQQGFLTTISTLSIGGHAMPPTRVVAAPATLPNRTGVLSPNAFAGQLVTFDFAHNRVRIADNTPANTPQSAPIPYGDSGRGHPLPSVPVTLGGQTWPAHIDTGAPGGIHFPYAMASSLPLAAPPVEVGRVHFVDGDHARYHATLNGSLRVGPLTLENPEIDFIDGLPLVNVGMGLLSQMVITVDPAGERSWAALAN